MTLVCAVVLVLVQRYYVPPLKNIVGLETIQSGGEIRAIRFEKNVTRKTVNQLVANLGDGSEIMIYDPVYDSPSDPGAFVSVVGWQGEFFLSFSNHGWSSRKLLPLTAKELEDYLWACRLDIMADSKRSYLDGKMRFNTAAGKIAEANVDRSKDAPYAAYIRERILAGVNDQP